MSDQISEIIEPSEAVILDEATLDNENENDSDSNNSFVTVSEDKMSVMLNLESPSHNQTYVIGDIIKILRKFDVTQGIDRRQLQEMIENEIYFIDTIVAMGKPATDGEDGNFVFHFRTEMSSTPKILPDGTVDYKNMELFEEVKNGQLLVEYKPATPGEFGYTVHGELLKPVRGKDLPPLRVKGVILSEDRRQYFSTMDGMIEYKNNIIEVKKLYTVNGDLDALVGNINFSGDVCVRGSVLSGYQIHAGGNVIVEGHVEAAEIYAGKNILLKKGMQGSSVGVLHAQGTISGVFFESVALDATETITANYLLNCKTITDQKIVVAGKKGVIIGGEAKAKLGVTCFGLGNIAEIPTRVEVGIDKNQIKRHQENAKNILKVDSEIKLFEEGIRKVALVDPPTEKTTSMYAKLVQAHQIKQNERNILLEERQVIMEEIDASNNTKIVVKGVVYPGVKVFIDTNSFSVKTAYKGVVFIRSGNAVIALSE